MDFFTLLPLDVSLQIYQFLSFTDALQASSTCKYFLSLLHLDKIRLQRLEYIQQNKQKPNHLVARKTDGSTS